MAEAKYDLETAAHLLRLQYASSDSAPEGMTHILESCLQVVSHAMIRCDEETKKAVEGIPPSAMLQLLKSMDIELDSPGEDWHHSWDVDGLHAKQASFSKGDLKENCLKSEDFHVKMRDGRSVGPFSVLLYPRGSALAPAGHCTIQLKGPQAFVAHAHYDLKPSGFRKKSVQAVHRLSTPDSGGEHVFINHHRDGDIVEYLDAQIDKLVVQPSGALLAHWAVTWVARNAIARETAFDVIQNVWRDVVEDSNFKADAMWEPVLCEVFQHVLRPMDSCWLDALAASSCSDMLRIAILKSKATQILQLPKHSGLPRLSQGDFWQLVQFWLPPTEFGFFRVPIPDEHVEHLCELMICWCGKPTGSEPEEEFPVQKAILNMSSWFYRLLEVYSKSAEMYTCPRLDQQISSIVCEELSYRYLWIEMLNQGDSIMPFWDQKARKAKEFVADYLLKPWQGVAAPAFSPELSVAGFRGVISFTCDLLCRSDSATLASFKQRTRDWIGQKLCDDRMALEALIDSSIGDRDQCWMIVREEYIRALRCASTEHERKVKRLKVMANEDYVKGLEEDRSKYEQLKASLRALPGLD